MKQSVDIVVVIPIGPGCKPEFIEDTVSSIAYYMRSSFKIILADDSQKNTGNKVKVKFPDADVFVTPAPMGKLCGLYITLSLAFGYALDNFDFRAVLRIDTDALLIGKQPEKEALALFEEHPDVGIAGQYPYDYQGRLWDRTYPSKQMYRMMHTLYFFRRPFAHLAFIKQYRKAIKNSYQRGESVFGGACFFSHRCLQTLREKGLLPLNTFKGLKLEEDHVFSLLAMSAGFRLGSLSGDGQSFGCEWIGLAASPESLIKSGKKIIHSTRFWNMMKEDEIRKWFREKRRSVNMVSVTEINNN